jgi:hypothetical protein
MVAGLLVVVVGVAVVCAAAHAQELAHRHR